MHDADGWLVFDGVTRRRPNNGPPHQDRVDGVVELHVPEDWLASSRATDAPPGDAAATWITSAKAWRQSPQSVLPPAVWEAWRGLLADLAAQYLADKPLGQDPAARLPGRPQRRRTEIRYRWCLFPGCRRPARQCHADHRQGWAVGGLTTDVNLGPACPHDHGLKTDHGWRLARTGPRTFTWISPMGRRHEVEVPRLVPAAVAPVPVAGSVRRTQLSEEAVGRYRDRGSDVSAVRCFSPRLRPTGDMHNPSSSIPAPIADGRSEGSPPADEVSDDEPAPF
ncbi:MAG: HNH endonuclease signature motif containing protein [Jatrophihabitans sp.]|uniref:HNH endonuclease signature motif containing protein n=1 Tax=Jatrophihabitans sp. TaxID=1932789 RepID=UPI003F7DE4B0